MIYVIISFFLFTIPLVVKIGWGDGIRFPKEVFSIIGLITIIAVSLYNYRLKPFRNKWLLLFWGWCFLTTILSNYVFPIYLNKIVIDMPSLLFAWKELFYISLSILAIICISHNKPKKEYYNFKFFKITFKNFDFKMIAKVISWMVIVVSIYGIIQAVGIDEWFRACDSATGWMAEHPLGNVDTGDKQHIGSIARRVVATVGNPSILAIFISICLPLCLYLRRKVGYIAFFLGLVIISLTFSAMAIVGAITGVFVYLWFNHKRLLFGLITLSIPLVLIFNTETNVNKVKMFVNPTGRIEVHKEAFKILRNKSITGMGLGTFEFLIGNNPKIVQKLENSMWKELHDEYGQIWWSTGLVGLFLFLCFIGSVIKQFFGNITKESSALFASLSVFMVVSLGHFSMRVSPISFYGVILLGLLMKVIGDKI